MTGAHALRSCFAVALFTISTGACGEEVGPGRELESEIAGYTVSGQASGTDTATGEGLTCVFLTGALSTGGPLEGSWTGSTQITVVRSREGGSQRVTYDTMIASQEVTLTALANGQFQVATAGPFADTLPRLGVWRVELRA